MRFVTSAKLTFICMMYENDKVNDFCIKTMVEFQLRLNMFYSFRNKMTFLLIDEKIFTEAVMLFLLFSG